MKSALITIISIIFLFITGCQRDEIINNPGITTQGVFVLYEGNFNQPSSFDYGFINVVSDSVKSNLFQNSNNGANLSPFPDGMVLLNDGNLYITCQGNYGSAGKMFKISSNDNKLKDTLTYGTNLYNLTYAQGNFYVTNIGGTRVTKVNTELDVIGDYEVGFNPKDPLYALDRIYVSKAAYAGERSLAVINLLSNLVTKVFFPGVPVSAAIQAGGVYVSTYAHKKLYVLDSLVPNIITDSFSINIPDKAIGDIIAGDRSIYIVGIADTNFGGYTGKNLYRFDIVTRTIDTSFTIKMTGMDDIYGIGYDYTSGFIYIANAKGFLATGDMMIYNKSGLLLKKYNTGGFAPKRFAFKY